MAWGAQLPVKKDNFFPKEDFEACKDLPTGTSGKDPFRWTQWMLTEIPGRKRKRAVAIFDALCTEQTVSSNISGCPLVNALSCFLTGVFPALSMGAFQGYSRVGGSSSALGARTACQLQAMMVARQCRTQSRTYEPLQQAPFNASA